MAKIGIDPIVLLLDALDQAYDRPAWHGPNLRGAIRRVTTAEAAWRPSEDRRCIADIVIHAAYWKYAVRRRLTGAKRGSFDLQGSNWFPLPEPWNDRAWRSCVDLMEEQHHKLREAVAAYPSERLHRRQRGSKWTPAQSIHGVALHDVYHAGQVQLLRRLRAAER